MVKAGIVGGTGYTGMELLRLLAQHPDVELRAITSTLPPALNPTMTCTGRSG